MAKSKTPKRPLPPGTTVLYVRAPEELIDRLKSAATAERRSLSAHALILLERALDNAPLVECPDCIRKTEERRQAAARNKSGAASPRQ